MILFILAELICLSFSTYFSTTLGLICCTTSSSNATKNWLKPGSPWRPARPLACLSSRTLPSRPMPITPNPPSSATPGPSLMSVPRPAIEVATVTAPIWPASLMISASQKALLALSTLWGTRSSTRIRDTISVSWILPTTKRIGCPVACFSKAVAIASIN